MKNKVQLPVKGNGFDPKPYYEEWGIELEESTDGVIYNATLPEGFRVEWSGNYHYYLRNEKDEALMIIWEDSFTLNYKTSNWKERFFAKTIC